MRQLIISISLLVLLAGCSNQQATNLPEHLADLQNLEVYTTDIEPAYQPNLVREMVFGDSEEFLIGSIGRVVVDQFDRVYLGDTQQKSIHILHPDGNYLTSIGREGEGPGEFQWIGHMQIHFGELFVYDPNSRRINVFGIQESLQTAPQFIHSIPVSGENFKSLPEENFMSPGLNRIRNDGSLILSSQHSIFLYREDPEFQGKTRYYLVNQEGDTSANMIFERNMPRHIVTEWFTIPPPFSARGLVAHSTDDRIFSAWTDNILIKVHNSDGVYERSFYHPFVKHALNREDAINSMDDNEQLHEAVENMQLPETWPALNRMFVDNQDRIWVATIVNDLELYEWWVMNDAGELLVRFEWPRHQSIIRVKDNFLYVRETEEDSGLQQIVRYRMEFTDS